MEQREIQSLCDNLLDRFMAALNAHDSAAMDECMHFPHVRMAGLPSTTRREKIQWISSRG